MVRRTRTNPRHSPAAKHKSNSKSLQNLFKNRKEQQPAPPALFEPHWEDDTSIDFLSLEEKKAHRPCYKECTHEECGMDCSMNDTSHSSFASHSMMQEENPLKTQKRRDRLERMRMDRDLVAQLELQNLALEQERKKRGLNASLNSFLRSQRRRAQAVGESVKTLAPPAVQPQSEPAPVEHPSSPFVRPRINLNTGKFLKNLNNMKLNLPLLDDSFKRHNESEHVGEPHYFEPDLPEVLIDDLEESKEQEVEEEKAPTLDIAEESFEVGRGRKGTKTIRRQGGGNKTRSLSPPLRSNGRRSRSSPRKLVSGRSAMRSSRVRRSPVRNHEIRW